MTIKELVKNFTDIAKQKNITLYHNNEYGVDSDIFNWLPNAVVTETPPPTGVWKSVNTENGTTEKTMLGSAVKMPLAQAIVKFTEMLKNGDFDKNETYRTIFLTETRNDSPLELCCFRDSDGELDLCVCDVGPGDVWRGAGAWFGSNEPLNFLNSNTLPLETLSLESAIQLVKEKKSNENNEIIDSVIDYSAIDNVKYTIKDTVRKAINFFAKAQSIASDYEKYISITNDKEQALKTLYTVYNIQDEEMKSEIEKIISTPASQDKE